MKKTVLSSLLSVLVSNFTFAANDTHTMEGHSYQSEDSEHTAMNTKPTRTIKVTASDNVSFTQKGWLIEQGEMVHFVITNQGNLNHEFSIGNHAEMLEHAEDNAKHAT